MKKELNEKLIELESKFNGTKVINQVLDDTKSFQHGCDGCDGGCRGGGFWD